MARARGGQIYSPDILEELKTAMAQESRAGEDDEVSFKLKVNALQRFLNHGMSRFSIDTWHHALHALFHTYQFGHSHATTASVADVNHDGQALPLTQLRSVGDVRAMVRQVLLQREGGGLREADTQALKYVDNFLSALQCLKEAKASIHGVYKFMHRYYYDPDIGRQNSRLRTSALSRSSTMQPPNANGRGPEQKAYELSAKQFGILTLQQMSGSTGHKLRRTVADMLLILHHWDRLMEDGPIQADDLDAESQQDLLLLSGTERFEPVLRLVPDVFAKFYKCLELTKQWWVLAHEIYPQLPINRPPTPPPISASPASFTGNSRGPRDSGLSPLPASVSGNSTEDQAPIPEQLRKVDEEIHVNEELLQTMQHDLKQLEERERHFTSLMETYEKVTSELDEKSRQLKELVAVREKETFPSQNQLVGAASKDPAAASDSNAHDGAKGLNGQVDKFQREIQMLQFQQSLLRQDYMLQLEVRPSMIRFADDLRLKSEQVQNNLTEQKMEKIRLQTRLEEEEKSPHSEKGSGSVFRDSLEDDNNDKRLSTIPVTSDTVTANEKKLELSRLQQRTFRDYSPGSCESPETLPAVTPDPAQPKRRKSQPQRQKEAKDVSTPNREHQANVSKSSVPKIKTPTDSESSSSTTVRAAKACSKASASDPDPRTTNVLFHRRTSKKELPAPAQANAHQSDKPLTRPRATSDPHALKARGRDPNSKLEKEPIRDLRTAESDRQGSKQEGKKAGTSSSPRARPEQAQKVAGDKLVQRTKPTGAENKEKDTLQKSKQANERKERDSTSQKPRPAKRDDAEIDSTSQKPKPAKRDNAEIDSTSQRPKPAKRNDAVVKQGDTDKKDDRKTLAPIKSDVEKDKSASQPKSKPGPIDAKRGIDNTTQGAKPGEATLDRHTAGKATTTKNNNKDGTRKSPKPKSDDASSVTSQGQKSSDVTTNHKVSDVKQEVSGKVASKGLSKDRPRPSHANGVIAKEKKHR